MSTKKNNCHVTSHPLLISSHVVMCRSCICVCRRFLPSPCSAGKRDWKPPAPRLTFLLLTHAPPFLPRDLITLSGRIISSVYEIITASSGFALLEFLVMQASCSHQTFSCFLPRMAKKRRSVAHMHARNTCHFDVEVIKENDLS